MSRIHCPELSAQVPLAAKEECHAPHNGINDMQQNGKHLNQQERARTCFAPSFRN